MKCGLHLANLQSLQEGSHNLAMMQSLISQRSLQSLLLPQVTIDRSIVAQGFRSAVIILGAKEAMNIKCRNAFEPHHNCVR